MITLEDCIAMCGLTEQEVSAIAEHEHIPEIAAAALAQYLLGQERGAGSHGMLNSMQTEHQTLRRQPWHAMSAELIGSCAPSSDWD